MDERYETAQVVLASVSGSLSFCPAHQMKPVVICCHIFVILSRGCPLSPGAEQRKQSSLRRPFCGARQHAAPKLPCNRWWRGGTMFLTSVAVSISVA